jgi:hypothetical protein
MPPRWVTVGAAVWLVLGIALVAVIATLLH